MNQYLARLVFEVTIDGRHDHFDRQLRLLSAADEPTALDACEVIAKGEEGTFTSRSGGFVAWHFIGISFFKCLSLQSNGEVIETETVKDELPDSFRQYVRLLDADIRTKTLTLV